MPYNYSQTGGSAKGSQPDAGQGNSHSAPVFAIVKDNIDPVRSGRIRVYIAGMSSNDPNDAQGWITVQMLTPFLGHTQGDTNPDESYNDLGKEGTKSTYMKNPTSYGFWYSPPDLESKVVVIFVEGDPNYGFWIGGTPRGEVLHTNPAVGCEEKVILSAPQAAILGGARKLPVCNINPAESNDPGFLDLTKPLHPYEAATLNQQGMVRDQTRGLVGSYSQRESPSRLGFGVLTPGRPIYAGGYRDPDMPEALEGASDASLKVLTRRTGHSLVMDDGSIEGYDNLVRLRTSHGHQIIMNDSEQTFLIIHANGQSWIELGAEGTIDLYSTNNINLRSHGDIEMHADRNITMHASTKFSVVAPYIELNSGLSTKIRTGTDFTTYCKGNYAVKVNKDMSMLSSGNASYASVSTTFINGSQVMINSGQAPLVPQPFKAMGLKLHIDTKFDPEKGFILTPPHTVSLTDRLPAHQPYFRAGTGSPIKVDLLGPTTEGAINIYDDALIIPGDPMDTKTLVTRPAIDEQVKQILDDPRIPPPRYALP